MELFPRIRGIFWKGHSCSCGSGQINPCPGVPIRENPLEQPKELNLGWLRIPSGSASSSEGCQTSHWPDRAGLAPSPIPSTPHPGSSPPPPGTQQASPTPHSSQEGTFPERKVHMVHFLSLWAHLPVVVSSFLVNTSQPGTQNIINSLNRSA